jgi:hypothetical protein
MKLDIVASIELTASAALVVATAAAVLGRSLRLRLSIAAILAVWFGWAIWLGQSWILHDGPLGTAVLGLSVMVPVIVLAIAVSRTRASAALREASLAPLVAMHAVRILGVNFLLLKAAGRLAPTFANTAGWGDMVVGVLAIPLAWALFRQKRVGAGVLRFWNTVGLLDLIAAVTLGVASAPGPLRFITESVSSEAVTNLPYFLIPGFLVPLLAASHLAIFWRLAHSERAKLDVTADKLPRELKAA